SVSAGMYVVLAGICMHFLWERRARTAGHYITSGYTILMFCVTIVYFTCSCKWSEIEFVELTMDPCVVRPARGVELISKLTITKNTASVVNIWLADSLILYRTWIIWQRSFLIVAFPFLVYLGSIATGIGTLYWASQPDGAFGQHEFTQFGTAFWSISVGFNVLSTLLITGKLVHHQRQMAKLQQHAEYLGLAAIVVESAAIYAVSGLIYIPLFHLNSPRQFAFSALLCSATVIAPTLIVLRIALGIAVKDSAAGRSSSEETAAGSNGEMGFRRETRKTGQSETQQASEWEDKENLNEQDGEEHPMVSV
ncbi:hypothetical protein AURDEDRAFT_66393, partial [Auricularia subglabra TFB-10046 SS5]